MKKQTQAIHTQFQRPDAYSSLSMPVYHTAAYEFGDAVSMTDAFCGRTDDPDYSRVMNPTVTFFENKVRALTGATDVIALSSGMAELGASDVERYVTLLLHGRYAATYLGIGLGPAQG